MSVDSVQLRPSCHPFARSLLELTPTPAAQTFVNTDWQSPVNFQGIASLLQECPGNFPFWLF